MLLVVTKAEVHTATLIIMSCLDENIIEQSGQNSRRRTDAHTRNAHMEYQSAHVQRRAADHLFRVSVVESVRNRIAGQTIPLARISVPEGHS